MCVYLFISSRVFVLTRFHYTRLTTKSQLSNNYKKCHKVSIINDIYNQNPKETYVVGIYLFAK